MIRFENVSIRRGGQVIVDQLSLTVRSGEKIALVGDSGVGKTSFLRAIVGIIPLTAGRIFIDDLQVEPRTLNEIRRKIAFIEQEPILGADGVRGALLLPFKFHANRNNRPHPDQVHHALEQVGLEQDILNKSTAVVSGGEKQRLALVRALLQNKQIILADEPTSALAADQRMAVVEVLTDSALTVIAVTHQPEWRGRADRVLTMQAGGLVAAGGVR